MTSLPLHREHGRNICRRGEGGQISKAADAVLVGVTLITDGGSFPMKDHAFEIRNRLKAGDAAKHEGA
jgi:hypothetical protein